MTTHCWVWDGYDLAIIHEAVKLFGFTGIATEHRHENSSDTEGCRAIVRSKSALVAPIPTAIAAI